MRALTLRTTHEGERICATPLTCFPLRFPLPLASTIAFAPVVGADPPRTPSVSCTGGGLSDHPTFSQALSGRAEYHFSGVCTTREGQDFGYRAAATWTPSETTQPMRTHRSFIASMLCSARGEVFRVEKR